MNIKISDIETIGELGPIFSTSEKSLEFFLNSKETFIKSLTLLKGSDSFREIQVIRNDEFKNFLKKLAVFLDDCYLPAAPEQVHGFVKRKSIITNAQAHTRKKIVWNLDISDFFDSISIEKVEGMFQSIGFKKPIAEVLAQLVTFNKKLGTGFPTSPVISNLIFISLDKKLNELAKKYQSTYSRYVDDITFSSDLSIPSRQELDDTLNPEGFFINLHKCRIYRRGGPQYVTGLNVVSSKPRLSKRRKRLIRLELHYIKKFTLMGHLAKILENSVQTGRLPSDFTNLVYDGYGIEGFCSYIKPIEPRLAERIIEVTSRS